MVAGYMMVKPEARAQAVQAAIDMVAETKKEQGCIAYDFYADLNDPNRFHVFEEWESDAALEAHFQTTHMKVFQGVLPAVLAGDGAVSRYVVETKTKLM